MSGTIEEAKSPTTLIIEYLRSKGITPDTKDFAQSVRRALEDNARDPGVIPGLRSDTPSVDSTTPKAAGAVGQGGGSSVAKRVTGGDPKEKYIDSGTIETPDNAGGGTSEEKTTSAAPSSSWDWSTILGPAAAGAAVGAGYYTMDKFGNRTPVAGEGAPASEYVGRAPPPDFAPAAPPDALGGPGEVRALEAGRPPELLPAPGSAATEDPFQTALNRAVQPEVARLGQGGASGGSLVPSNTIPLPDQTSGPTITPANEVSTRPAIQLPDQSPRVAPVARPTPGTPGAPQPNLFDSFMQNILGKMPPIKEVAPGLRRLRP